MTPADPADPLLVAPVPAGDVRPGVRPSFSVIVAAWEVADLIGIAVRSALEQSEPPQEVIVVDDVLVELVGIVVELLVVERETHAEQILAPYASLSQAVLDRSVRERGRVPVPVEALLLDCADQLSVDDDRCRGVVQDVQS